MKRLALALALCGLSSAAMAQRVTVQNGRPTAVFTPVSGGYLLKQPGMQPNLSSIPKEINPSAGIPGKPGFAGGKQYRMDGTGDFEMGGKYDMPIPKTGQKVPVDVVSKVPKAAMSKALLKALPLVGTVVAAAEVLEAIRDQWDATEPGNGPSEIDYNKSTVSRSSTEYQWELSGKTFPSPSAACSSLKSFDNKPLGASAVFISPTLFECRLDGSPLGYTTRTTSRPVVVVAPESVIDSVAEATPSAKVEEILEEVQSGPNASKMDLNLPADAPTTVTGPASVPSSTTTSTASDGTQTTTTNETKITYIDNTTNITTTTTTTTTNPSGETNTTTSTTTDTATPDDPNPTTPEEKKDGLLCSLFPDILACKKLEEPPPEELPKRDQNITLQTGPSFAGGSCPPDVVVSVGGQQITVLSTAEPCGWIESYMKPIILLLASISAVFIVLPRGGD